MTNNAEQKNRIIRTVSFTAVPNTIILDNRLSAQAKGVACYFYSRPDDWTFYWNEIISNFKNGRDAIKSAFLELKELGYITVHKNRKSSGEFCENTYELHENPINTENGITDDGKPVYGKSVNGESASTNTNINKTERTNNNISSDFKLFDYENEKENDDSNEDFETWWKSYPSQRRVNKSGCSKKFKALPKETRLKIIEHTDKMKKSGQWDNPTFVPLSQTYINQERWLAEVFTPAKTCGGITVNTKADDFHPSAIKRDESTANNFKML